MFKTAKSRFLAGAALLVVCAVLLSVDFRQTSAKPNVLVIMVDDLGYNDLAINNDNPGIDTPNLDRIAREGIRFTRHYAHSSCSPARAAFLTGMYPERLGFLPGGRGISPGIVTLADRLQASGYTTWHIGKWHIGEFARAAWPDFQGFDHWFGFLNQDWLAGAHEDGKLKLRTPRYDNPWLAGDSEPGAFYPGHLENILTDKAIEVISQLDAAHSPWFLNVWFFAPHAPVQPSREFAERYPDTPGGRYRALVSQLDNNIGRIIAHMDSIGALDNTLVVIVSDNGGTNNELDNNAPFHGRKTQNEEGGLRTPLIVLWPDSSMNGQVFEDYIGIEDLYPTVLEAVGIDAPAGLDGVSYFRALSGQAPAPKKFMFWESSKGSYGVLSPDGRWRLYQPRATRGVIPKPHLYDLEQDPAAAHWLESPPQSQVASLQAEYLRWYKSVHSVKTELAERQDGSRVLKGMDFSRTPGFGGYTIGFEIPGNFRGLVASQQGIWRVERDGDRVMARFGELVLSAELPDSQTCHRVVITGNFIRRTASWFRYSDRYGLELWIDGKKVDSKEADGVLPVGDPSTDTVIGRSGIGDQAVELSPPVILNTYLDATTPWSLEAFSESLCAGS